MSRSLSIGLLLVAGLISAGRFLPGVQAWGFNQFAYLPTWMFGIWLAGVALMFWSRSGAFLGRLVTGRPGAWLMESAAAPFAVAVLAGLLFATLGRGTHFLGDGTWLSANVTSGHKFHFFDFVDYRLHALVYQVCGGRIPADVIYRAGSVLAGVIASVALLLLVRRLPWETWRRALLYLLLFSTPPVVLYFGYVESYSFLYATLSAFLVAALLALDRRVPLWVASSLFGFGLLLHLSALFSLPALLYLGRIATSEPARRRWLQIVIPPAIFVLLAGALYAASGYDAGLFRQEFLDSSQGQGIFLPLLGEHGWFSWVHWKDLGNQLMLTAPVCLVVVLAGYRSIAGWRRQPALGFLLVQVAAVALVRMVVDAKLGGAKDWDLVIAQSASLPLLAALALRPLDSSLGPSPATRTVPQPSERLTSVARRVGPVLGLSVLITIPWVLLQSLPDRSIRRLIEVTADAPVETRTYVLEEVGRYYREQQDWPRAVVLYEECVRRASGHARLRAQLGALYYYQGDLARAEREHREALRINPDTQLSLELLIEILLGHGHAGEALLWARHLTGVVAPDPHTSWVLRGRAALIQEQWAEAAQAYEEAIRRHPSAENERGRGLALLRLGKPAEAVTSFRRALAAGGDDASARVVLAWALVEAAAVDSMEGSRSQSLVEAERILRSELNSDPSNEDLGRLLERAEELR